MVARWHCLRIVLLLCICSDVQGFGQSYDLVLNCAGGCNSPHGVSVDPTTDYLFIADTLNSRVLRYGSVYGLSSSSTPLAVFGQNDFTSTSPNQGQPSPTPSSMYYSWGIAVDRDGTLWVADSWGATSFPDPTNARVLWWKSASAKGNGTSSDGSLLGPGGPSATTMSVTAGVFVDNNGTLWVSDHDYNRVLRFDNVSTINSGAPAVGVLGQLTFVGSASRTTPDGMSHPNYIAGDQMGGLYVADFINSRVLYFTPTAARSVGGASASFAFMQKNLSTNVQVLPPTASTGIHPNGMAVGPEGQLFVSDATNHRVLLFENALPPTSNGMAASDAIGQLGFDATNSWGNGTDQLYFPSGLAYHQPTDSLWVCDSFNNRVLRYSGILYPQSQSFPGLNLALTFQGRTPNVEIWPTGFKQEYQMLLQLDRIEEADPVTNATFLSVVVPKSGYALRTWTDVTTNTQHFDFTYNAIDNGAAQLLISYSLFAQSQTIQSAGVSFLADPSSLKLSIAVTNWTFASSSNVLDLFLSFHPTRPLTQVINLHKDNETVEFELVSQGFATVVKLLKFSVVNNITITPVGILLDDTGRLCIRFQSFTSSLMYDPDLSVTVDRGDGGGTDLSLLALLSLIVVPLACCLTILLGGILWAIRKYQMKRKVNTADAAIFNEAD